MRAGVLLVKACVSGTEGLSRSSSYVADACNVVRVRAKVVCARLRRVVPQPFCHDQIPRQGFSTCCHGRTASGLRISNG